MHNFRPKYIKTGNNRGNYNAVRYSQSFASRTSKKKRMQKTNKSTVSGNKEEKHFEVWDESNDESKKEIPRAAEKSTHILYFLEHRSGLYPAYSEKWHTRNCTKTAPFWLFFLSLF